MKIIKLTTVLMAFYSALTVAAPLGTQFNYQGQLVENGVAVSGTYDFQFIIYDTTAGGAFIELTDIDAVEVIDGLFTVELDFGDAPFQTEQLYLEIRVRSVGAPVMDILSPRQKINTVPFAIQSKFTENSSSPWQEITGGVGYTQDVKVGNLGTATASMFTVDAAAVSPVRFKVSGSTKMIINTNGGTSLGNNSSAPDNGLRVEGNTRQPLSSHGFVKAGTFIQCGSGISGGSERFFNNQNGTDFAVSNPGGATGSCIISTPFDISDAYFVVSAVNIGGLGSGTLNPNCSILSSTELICQIVNTFGSTQNGELQLIIY